MREHVLAADSFMPRIPVGHWFETVVDWLNNNVGPLFDAIITIVQGAVDGLTSVLQAPPSWVMMIIFALIGTWLRNWKFGVGALLGFALIDAFEVFDLAMLTLSLVLVAGTVAVLIAVPIGILAARSDAVSRVVRPILDFQQTLPAFIYLVPVVFLFRTGITPGVVATVFFALPPGVRLTELGIRQVDKEMVEAGEAFGASPRRILTEIQLPLAIKSIMAGVNQIIMLSLSMTVIAAMVGAPGLGAQVFESIGRLRIDVGFEAGLGVVILAIYLDRITSALGTRSELKRTRKFATA